jgi:hypothetical protein
MAMRLRSFRGGKRSSTSWGQPLHFPANGILAPKARAAKHAPLRLRPPAETGTRSRCRPNAGYSRTFLEISGNAGLRGRPGRTRTSNQTVMSAVTSSEIPMISGFLHRTNQRTFTIGCGQSLAKRWWRRWYVLRAKARDRSNSPTIRWSTRETRVCCCVTNSSRSTSLARR